MLFPQNWILLFFCFVFVFVFVLFCFVLFFCSFVLFRFLFLFCFVLLLLFLLLFLLSFFNLVNSKGVTVQINDSQMANKKYFPYMSLPQSLLGRSSWSKKFQLYLRNTIFVKM